MPAAQGAATLLLRTMASPVRLQVLVALQHSEKNVSALLEEIKSTQPNLSQHLGVMHKAGMLDRRRDGTSVYYRIADGHIGAICLSVCRQVSVT